MLSAPQHLTPPPVVIAHECISPVTTATAPLESPTTSTGEVRETRVPSPSCPKPLLPQHLTPPSVVMTQLCESPEAIAEATSGAAATSVAPSKATAANIPRNAAMDCVIEAPRAAAIVIGAARFPSSDRSG